jgi:hypothetical protein
MRAIDFVNEKKNQNKKLCSSIQEPENSTTFPISDYEQQHYIASILTQSLCLNIYLDRTLPTLTTDEPDSTNRCKVCKQAFKTVTVMLNPRNNTWIEV